MSKPISILTFLKVLKLSVLSLPSMVKFSMSSTHCSRLFITFVGLVSASICHAENNLDADSKIGSSVRSKQPLSFNADVRPLLSNHCFFCHGPDAENRQADLRLDVEDEVDLEEILARIESTDEGDMMPPPDAHKPLNADQIAVLKRWISEGGKYEAHWSFESLEPQTTPRVAIPDWNENYIDRFVLSKLQQNELQPSESADRRTLLRRLSFDLTGLPPTRTDIAAFLGEDSPTAYEDQVDRLLASDYYGQHMARYWLDLVRFADTNGLHHDHYREMTPYRDWVIDAFNDNLPFDKFTHWQIAGDLYENPTRDQLIASGFNRLHLIIDVGTALPEESFNRNVVDRVSAVGTAFMGLTLQCASCHDHKYDPITQQDFYQMYAFFNNLDAEPETGHRGGADFRRGLQKPYINLTTPHQESLLRNLRQQNRRLNDDLKFLRAARKDDSGLVAIADQEIQLKNLEQREAKLLDTIPAALIMKERADVRPAHILIRGVYDQYGPEVQRDTPEFLPPLQSDHEVKTRMDLARWLTDPKNPLTARVTVNRIWQQLFGVGLVKTSEDFGAQGESPRYRELLDQLSIDFIESGWDVKKLVRTIVMSRTYRQTSSAATEDFQSDPENRWLARGARYRIDAEMIRDQILSVTGVLNHKMNGKSVKPPQPEGLWKLVTMPSSNPRAFKPSTGPDIYRRSVYTFWKRGLPPPQMTIFDAPNRDSCIARRERTNTPLQALVLMNETEYFRITLNYAAKLLSQPRSTDQMLDRVYETITSQALDDGTREQLQTGLELFREQYQQQPELADEMVSSYLEEGNAVVEASEISAWTMLVHSLLNLDITRTRE